MKKNVNCKTKNIFANPLIEVWLTYKRLNVLDICDLFGFEIRVCLETITTLCQEPIHHLQEFLPALAQVVENLPTEQKTWVRSLSWEGPLEKGMATHSSMLAWRIPWTEEPGGLQSMESQRVRHDWAPQHSTEGLEADVLVSAVVSEQMLLGLPLCCFVAAAPRTPRLLFSRPGGLASVSLPFTIPSWPFGSADVVILFGSGHQRFGPPALTLWLSKPVLFRPLVVIFHYSFLPTFCSGHKLSVFWGMHRLPRGLSQHPGLSHRHVPTFWPWTVVWRSCCMEVPGLEMLKPHSSYTLLAGPWP